MKLIVNKLMYCGFSACISETNKVVYCVKYAPKSGTIRPNLEIGSSDLDSDTHITREEFINFINSDVTRQPNGKHKGGKWGTNNFTVTSDDWFPGLYVGDTIKLTFSKIGLIPNKFNNKQPIQFSDSDDIIVGSQNLAWSCNAMWNNQEYHFYMTDNPMPQVATDTFFINYIKPKNTPNCIPCWLSSNKNKIYTKVLRRGLDTKVVDSPGREMPCAGEHLEPGQSDDTRQQVIFTVNEELGIHKKTLSKCYLLELGVYNKPGRDGRYSKYCIEKNGKNVEFGIERESSSTVRILLIISEILDMDDQDVLPDDTNEINSKRWVEINKVLSDYNEDNWMLTEHLEMLKDAVAVIENFVSEQEILPNGTDTKAAFKF